MPMLRIDVSLQAPPSTTSQSAQTPRPTRSELQQKARKVEDLLVELLLAKLRGLKPDEKLMLELSFPVGHNAYLPLIQHPNTVRVAANSGFLSRKEACKRLAKNFGMVAVFGK